ncbi:MAG: YlmH/Sll1252 family protein [Eubacteriales bacterium]|nr:YlmH/Sll1252 family protein [Eubacteriales bacterium]
MEKRNDIFGGLARTQEERILLAQVADKAETCRERSYLTYTKFLDMHEAALAARLLHTLGSIRARFWGGYADAERKLLFFLPDWMEELPAEDEDCPITAIRCLRNKGDALSHRDYLGSLMGLGLRRDGIGDILVGEHGADIIVYKEIAPYLLTNYAKAGRKSLHVEEIPIGRIIVPEEKVTMLRDTVASMRLDSITASMFRMSRAKAADAIRAGKVFVNQQECLRTDQEVREKDRITLRGTGRGEVDEILGESKKGRIVVSLKRFG